MQWTDSELGLYGEFNRPEHAARWLRALMALEDPRHTRKRMRDMAERNAPEAA